MKNLNKIFVAFLLIIGLNTQAQDSNNPWAITFGTNAVDTRASAAKNANFIEQFDQIGNINKNWNVLPSVSYLSVSKYIASNFSLGLAGSVNKITKIVMPVTFDVVNPGDLTYYSLDSHIKYSLMNLISSKVLDPSLHLGGGYNWFGENSTGTLDVGAGINFWLSENVGIALKSNFKKSFAERELVPSHFQHTGGLTFKFGAEDKDGDGISDKEDACPDVKGLKEFKGCPDTDGDGIADKDDACIDTPGTAEFNGCADTDGDGVADNADDCPEVAGLKSMKGCPDSDGDGVADSADKCPTVKGAKDNSGCPYADTDGDGILDKDDKCVDVKGTLANNGCPDKPAVDEATMKTLNDYGKIILFDTSKFSFQKQTMPILQAMTAILKEYPTAKFSLEGHTDSDAADDFNMKLSQDRADAVVNYLVENGIAKDRLSATGYGETKPVADNKTAKGKALNRRVEVKLMK